ncbi:MAG: MFS transporter [Betaproteobacteria bacterium]|nr:MFS transporter [Betaproteobacteria bacterium]
MVNQRASGKVFYGWKIAGASFGLQFLQATFLHQAFGAYIAVMRETFDWSKTAFSAAAAIQQLEGALLGPIQGWFIDKFGPRGMIRSGVLMFGAGMMMLSQVESIGFFYLTFVVLALGASLGGYFPLSIAIMHWFERKRARALSLITLGFAMGGMCVPLIAWALTTFGWRVTAFASGVIVIVLGLPLAGVVRNRPRDMGEVVDGEPEAHAVATAAQADAAVPADFTLREALRTSAFWLVSWGHAFAMFVVGAINVHAITHMKEGLGYTLGEAALVVGLQTTAQVGGIVMGWFVGDRYDKRILAAGCMFAHMVALLLLAYAVSLTMVITFALLNGVAWGMRGSFMQAIRADYFGRRAIGMIMGISSMVVVVGQIGGPLFAGIMADATGNYKLGFTILAILAGMGSMFFVLARKPKPLQRA